MKKCFNLFWNKKKYYHGLVSINKEAIDDYNKKTLSSLLLIGWTLSLFPLISAIFNENLRRAMIAYALTFTLFLILYLLFLIPKVKKHGLIGLYISFTVFISLGIYLSIVQSPNMQATILLGGFVIMPLCILDRPLRMNLFLVFWLIVHTILAFTYKPQNALIDLLNTSCATLLGSYLGVTMMHVRLEGFEARRLLTIEKETDLLTGLFNRRKLFETLVDLETSNIRRPSGILMIDIDHFKEYNDKQGHAGGDMCLSHLGEIFTKFAQNFNFVFYRYGGEEFLAMAYGYGKTELLAIAESLRIIVQNSDFDHRNVTVSIGLAFCGDRVVQNYENIIDLADKAAYNAKNNGRNNVYMYKDDF